MKAIAFAAAVLVSALGSASQANVLISETFDTDGPISSYTGTGETFSAYVASGVGTSSASGGKLNMQMIGDGATGGMLYAHADLGGAKSLVSMKMDFQRVLFSDADVSFQLMLGGFDTISDFNPGAHIYGDRAWAKVMTGDDPYPLTAGTGSTITTNEMITWSLFLNQSGETKSFVGPDGANYSVDDNRWSMFVGTALLGGNMAKGSEVGPSTENLQGIIFNVQRNWVGGTSNLNIDNLVVRDDLELYTVPEPTSLTLLGLVGLALGRRRVD